MSDNRNGGTGINLNDLLQAVNEYNHYVKSWLDNNKLVELPEYNELHDKNVWGVSYRADQMYYEKLSEFKSNYFSTNSLLLDMIAKDFTGIDGRANKLKAEKEITVVENRIKDLDNRLFTAKQRLKFYETLTYVVGNAIYGAY